MPSLKLEFRKWHFITDHFISFSLLKMFDSSSLPNNVFISTLVGTGLHAGCRQKSHLLTANYPQLMFKFTFILSIKKTNRMTIFVTKMCYSTI